MEQGDTLRFWCSASGLRKLLWRLLLGGPLGGLIYAGYWVLQRVELRPVWWLQPEVLDPWIPYCRGAGVVYLYLSFYLLVLVPGLLPTDLLFRRFLIALGINGAVSLVVFLLVPSGVLRPPDALAGASRAYTELVGFDLPRNAFPSLHVSASTLSAITGTLAFRDRGVQVLLWLWVLAVVWSTMATRQHVLIDVVSGALLASVAWMVAGRLAGGGREASPLAR